LFVTSQFLKTWTAKLLLLAIFSVTGMAAAQAENWGSFRKQCIRDGVAKYSSVLRGIPVGQSWEKACARSTALINGQRVRPTRCVNTGTAMWGEFEMSDASCNRPKLQWGSFKDNGCVILDRQGWGMRSYSSVLWNIPAGQSWEKTCANTPANVGGHYFAHPTACVKTDIKDAMKITKRIAKMAAKRLGRRDPRIMLASLGVMYSAEIMKQINPALNMWGVFYVPDSNCPHFGGFH
jgi:hypothetical protein